MSVRVVRGAAWTTETPKKVFDAAPYYRGQGNNITRTYDASENGERFLMIKNVVGSNDTAARPTVIVARNWFEELKRLVPVP